MLLRNKRPSDWARLAEAYVNTDDEESVLDSEDAFDAEQFWRGVAIQTWVMVNVVVWFFFLERILA